MIPIHMPNTQAAEKVLAAFKKIVKTKEKNGSEFIVCMTYTNCREQGYSLCEYVSDNLLEHRQVTFSENRNSDDIVVYYGTQNDFDANTNIASEVVWRDFRKFFRYNQHEAAAKFIYDYLVLGVL